MEKGRFAVIPDLSTQGVDAEAVEWVDLGAGK